MLVNAFCCDVAQKLKCNGKDIGRCVKRQADNRKKLEIAAIMKLYALLDRMNVKMPTFVAVNISRISDVKPLKTSTVALSAGLADLKAQVQSIALNVQNKSKPGNITVLFLYCGISTRSIELFTFMP